LNEGERGWLLKRIFKILITLTFAGCPVVTFAHSGGNEADKVTEDPICTDRPTNGNYACTVPKGVVQIEADTISWTRDRVGSAQTDIIAFSTPVIKYGLGESSDIQLAWTPYLRARIRDANGTVTTIEGPGDVTLRFKQRMTGPRDEIQFALLPFVKLPTARDSIGNGKVEGGIAVPINYYLPHDWVITLGPQVNLYANFDGSGHHPGLSGLINIAKSFGAISFINEFWTGQDFDPSGTVRQYSYNTALVWLVNPDIQLDVGANFGLNRNTPDVVSYIGISARF
jgi:hypothetical protein